MAVLLCNNKYSLCVTMIITEDALHTSWSALQMLSFLSARMSLIGRGE